MKYMIEFELPDNDTVQSEIKTAEVAWGIWGYRGCTKARPVQGWIPCSERLPDDEENEYLVTILDRDDDVCEVYKGFYQDGKWWTQWCHGCLELEKEPCGDNIVTAWMPLPEPYREGR